MARILLGVTGGIAAYKACELDRLLVKRGHDVVPLVTPGAERFVARRDVPRARPPAAERGPLRAPDARRPARRRAVHGEHAREARARRSPTTCSTEAALAHRGPVLVAPAMNPRMWAHPATARERRDAARARRRARRPRRGRDGRGRVGRRAGWPSRRRSPPASSSCSRPASLAGRRVLVTAGGTREPLDAVRFLGNRSSGRMGVALAEEAQAPRRGGRPARGQPRRARRRRGRGGRRRRRPRRCSTRRSRSSVDVALLAAAVADYRPAEALAGKRPKDDETLDGRARADDRHRRARSASASAPGQVLVAFGAEHGEEGLERKRGMLDDEERRSGRLQRRLPRRHRLRRRRERGRRSSRAAASGSSRRRRSSASPRRSSTRRSAPARAVEWR